MRDKPPVGKMARTLVSGRTAATVGGKVLLHYAKRPFMGPTARRLSEEAVVRDSAQTLFAGLSLLKGTALKLAQVLSLESDLLPEAACRELSKACHQVPPINRALVRQAVRDALGETPERLFDRFDLTAFAAASLGQVHRAGDKDGTALAVKIQYPGISATIDHDIDLLRRILGPMIQKEQLTTAIEEVSVRLHEEIDYVQEAENLNFFNHHLKMDGVRLPALRPELSSRTVLTTTLMPGTPLDQWLLGDPDPAAVDRVAQTLQDIFVTGLYQLYAIHADPNPGNFIIGKDLSVGVVDFGCIKKFDAAFVEQYRRLSRAAYHRRDDRHFKEMRAMRMIPEDLEDKLLDKIKIVSKEIGQWFGRLCEEESFDFRKNADYMASGKASMTRFHQLSRYVRINPHILFLDRTRYGLLRLFEQMGARVCFRNAYEW